MPIQYEYEEYARDRNTVETLAIALGWFSIALGAAELLAPQQVARLIGVPPGERTTATLRGYGAREVASGLAILAQPAEAKWLWSRVGGDGIDLASLSAAAGQENADRRRLAIATAAVAAVATLDVFAATRLRSSDGPFEFSVDLRGEQAITLKAPLEVVEAAWVEWCASGHAKLKNNYAVRFEPAPGARGTEVHLSGGGSTSTIREELRRFKQRLETGEVLLSDGPSLARPARPRDAAGVNSTAEVL
jgi:hypothetical protein